MNMFELNLTNWILVAEHEANKNLEPDTQIQRSLSMSISLLRAAKSALRAGAVSEITGYIEKAIGIKAASNN